MEIHHIYTGEDGTSRMKTIDIPMEAMPNGSGSRSAMLTSPGFFLREMPPGMVADWHPAPRRQIVCTISGEAEIETGDGQVLQIGPGTIQLLEDTHGQGHITRIKGTESRISIFLPLDDDVLTGL